MNEKQGCGGADCIESIENPGFCVWCDEPMPDRSVGVNAAGVIFRNNRFAQTEPCCYGFIAGGEGILSRPGKGAWTHQLQRPFRTQWLWLWGGPSAVLTSLKIAMQENLAEPVPFALMSRDFSPQQFLAFVELSDSELVQEGLWQLLGNRLQPALARGFGAPHLQLPAGNVGAQISLEFHGLVQGVVLVGEQLK